MFRKFFSKKIKKTLAKAERFWYNEFKASSTTASSTTAFFLYMSIVLFACQILYYGGTFEMKKGNFKAVLMAALVMGFVLACNEKVFASGGSFTYVNASYFGWFPLGKGESPWLDCDSLDYAQAQGTVYDGRADIRLYAKNGDHTGWKPFSGGEKGGNSALLHYVPTGGSTKVRVELKYVKGSASGYIWVD